jgi:hypothetical protein
VHQPLEYSSCTTKIDTVGSRLNVYDVGQLPHQSIAE